MTRPANDKQFDSHHVHSREDGYQAAEYEHQEYPKEVRKVVDGADGSKEEVAIVNDAAEEAEFFGEAEAPEENQQ